MLGEFPNRESVKAEYDRIWEKYGKFLNDEGIDILDVQYRVKEFDSFYEKIQRKGYRKPFDEVEDICGLRIICYFPSDLDKISKLIEREFDVLESKDKADLLEPDRFGYRSLHFIVSTKKEWLKAPNYRGLSGLKAEIQVRTILMHAWADVEYKLAYKKKEHVPPQLRRKLYQLSALFEVADNHLESIREEREGYKRSLVDKKRETITLDPSQELNVDNLQAVLDLHFPDRVIGDVPDLLDELLVNSVSMKEIEDGYNEVKDILLQSEEELLGGKPIEERRMSQTGIVRHILDLTHDAYWSSRKGYMPEFDAVQVRKWRAILATRQS